VFAVRTQDDSTRLGTAMKASRVPGQRFSESFSPLSRGRSENLQKFSAFTSIEYSFVGTGSPGAEADPPSPMDEEDRSSTQDHTCSLLSLPCLSLTKNDSRQKMAQSYRDANGRDDALAPFLHAEQTISMGVPDG
jgi:hypothetical protein